MAILRSYTRRVSREETAFYLMERATSLLVGVGQLASHRTPLPGATISCLESQSLGKRYVLFRVASCGGTQTHDQALAK